MRRADAAGMALVLLTLVAMEAFRRLWMEPRAVGLACVHDGRPAICQARTMVGWLTYHSVWGSAALVLGIVAIATACRPICVAATCMGVLGAVNYNVSWGVLGLVLGSWAWLRPA